MPDNPHPSTTLSEGELANSSSFPAIGSLAAIGDGRSLALIAPDGNIEWFCPGRFDNPPLVWPLLDRARGGCLFIGSRTGEVAQSAYIDDTAVVETTYTSATGSVSVTLGMEWPGSDDQQTLLWVARGLEGTSELAIAFGPQPDFGRQALQVVPHPNALELAGEHLHLVLQADCELRPDGDNRWIGGLALAEGETAVFALSVSLTAGRTARPLPPPAIPEKMAATIAAWQQWSEGLTCSGVHRPSVVRSAITLKLLIYEPTGAVVAAATTSLPEGIGGQRNWDYRYTWFRDAGLTLNALFALGCKREAHRWAQWMQTTIGTHGTPLRVLYTVDGEQPQPEEEIPAVSGYLESLPVRVGNGADGQFQLDVYGELLDCVFICDTMADDAMLAHWPHMRAAADFIAAHWHEPDSGIWEVRSEPRHFVHSKVMAWAGLQRALWLQDRHQLEGDRATWEREAGILRAEVLTFGISPSNSYFVRAYGEEAVDASLLLIARTGFVDASDPLFVSTVEAIQRELSAGHDEALLWRYLSDGSDGLPGTEGTFTICSFWLVEALQAIGRQAEAEVLFDRLLALGGSYGLYAEEIDASTKAQLGNMPQAFSHVGLINAALSLQHSLSSKGRF